MRRRAAFLTAGVAAGAVAAGVAGRAVLRHQRAARDPEAHEPLSRLPADDLGPVGSFDGTQLAVRAEGPADRPAVLFSHGFSLDMTTWHYQWVGLGDRYRVVLYDQRGHGRSGPAAGGDLSIEALGRDLLAVVEELDPPDRVLLAGHSMGSLAILAAARLAPEVVERRVAGLFLVGATAGGLTQGALGFVGDRVQGLLRPRLSAVSEAARRVDRWRKLLLERGTDVGYLLTRATQFNHDASPTLVEYVAGLAGHASPEVWTDGLAALVDVDLLDAATELRLPAVVVVGDGDRVTPPAAAVALASALPEGHLEVLEGAGHMAMMERHEEVTALLAAFADRVLGRRTRRRSGAPTSGGRRRR